MLGKTIGAGSMGKVKLARKEDGSEQVCFGFILFFYVAYSRALFHHSAIRIHLPLMPLPR
jgi:hypothetical protein